MLTKIVAILVAGSLLSGCATLTAAGIATAVSLGVITGGGKYVGERAISRAQAQRLIWKKCSRLKTEVYRQRCINRLNYALHQYHD